MLHFYEGTALPPHHRGGTVNNVEGQVGGDTIHLQEEGGLGLQKIIIYTLIKSVIVTAENI